MSRKVALLICGLLFTATPAFAGPLDGHASAIPAFTGSTSFASGSLTGYVDYAVFLPDDWPGYAGYTPTPGEVVYTYQVYVTGTAPLSSLDVGIDNQPADNIGSFTDGDGTDAPIAAFLNPGGPGPQTDAEWDFAGILQGNASIGLAYSSPNLPQDFFGSVLDTGQSAFVIPLPSPGPEAIPEPSTLVLAGLGIVGLICMGRRRK